MDFHVTIFATMMLLTFDEIALPLGLLGLVLLAVILLRRRRGWLHAAASAVFGLYLLALVGLTLFPIPIPGPAEARTPAAEILARANFLPFEFRGLFYRHPVIILRELVGNVLLTIPFGLLLPLLAQVRAWVVPLLALAVGLAIESAQLLISLIVGAAYRGVDVNDVLLNAAGVLIGYMIFRVLRWLYSLGRTA